MLGWVVLRCVTRRCVVSCCVVLCRVGLCRLAARVGVLCHVMWRCVVLCCVVLCCVVLCCVVLCCVVLCCIGWCCVALRCVVLCCVVLCCVVLCCVVSCRVVSCWVVSLCGMLRIWDVVAVPQWSPVRLSTCCPRFLLCLFPSRTCMDTSPKAGLAGYAQREEITHGVHGPRGLYHMEVKLIEQLIPTRLAWRGTPHGFKVLRGPIFKATVVCTDLHSFVPHRDEAKEKASMTGVNRQDKKVLEIPQERNTYTWGGCSQRF